jgi:hypothetical protein
VLAGGDDRERDVTQAPHAAPERLAGGEIDAVSDRGGDHAAQRRRFGLGPDGKRATGLVSTHGVDEHHARNLRRVRAREQTRQQPAVGMTHEHVRRVDGRMLDQPLEVADLIARVPDTRRRNAAADPGAVVGAGARVAAE